MFQSSIYVLILFDLIFSLLIPDKICVSLPDVQTSLSYLIALAFYSGSFHEFFRKIKGFPIPGLTPEKIIFLQKNSGELIPRNCTEFYGKIYRTW